MECVGVWPQAVVPVSDAHCQGAAEGVGSGGRQAARRGDHVVQGDLSANAAAGLAERLSTGECVFVCVCRCNDQRLTYVPCTAGDSAATGRNGVCAGRLVARRAELGRNGGGDAELLQQNQFPGGVAQNGARPAEAVEQVAARAEREGAGVGANSGRRESEGEHRVCVGLEQQLEQFVVVEFEQQRRVRRRRWHGQRQLEHGQWTGEFDGEKEAQEAATQRHEADASGGNEPRRFSRSEW